MFANDSFNPVPCDCFPDPLCYGDTNSRCAVLTGAITGYKVLVLHFSTLLGDMKKFASLSQPVCFGICVTAQQKNSRNQSVLLFRQTNVLNLLINPFWQIVDEYNGWRLSGQPLSAFLPSPVDNSSSCLRGHPMQKAMRSGSFNLAWLVCSFHFLLPL
jgi:hypothetical protein